MSMTDILTERQLREGEYRSLTRGINTAFLLEIKQDHVEFRVLFKRALEMIRSGAEIKAREFAELLGFVRDEIETYFSLEEFYGGFDMAFQADAGHAANRGQTQAPARTAVHMLERVSGASGTDCLSRGAAFSIARPARGLCPLRERFAQARRLGA